MRSPSTTQAAKHHAGWHRRQPAPAPDIEDWYANLLWIDGRKNLLLTHTATLFTIFQPDIRAADLRRTHMLLCALIDRELTSEQLPAHTFGESTSEPLLLAATADRSVLGAMSDMAHACKHTIHQQGGLAHTNIPALNHSCAATSPAPATTSHQSS